MSTLVASSPPPTSSPPHKELIEMSGSFVTHYVQEDEHSPVENSPPFAHIQAPCKAASPSPVPTILYDSIQSSPGKDTVPARQIVPPRLTDHTYHDYASEICQYPITKKSKSNFPAKLHRMISDPANSQIIQWQPHGRAWKVLDKESLVEDVIPKYFVQTKYESFTRQLSGWGFKRLHRPGPDYRCYYNECFLRGLPHLTHMMKRVEPNQGKLLPHVEAEPNFYESDLMYLLPPSNVPLSFPLPMQAPVTAYHHTSNWHPNNYHYQNLHPVYGSSPYYPAPPYEPPPYHPYAYHYYPQQIYPFVPDQEMPSPYGSALLLDPHQAHLPHHENISNGYFSYGDEQPHRGY